MDLNLVVLTGRLAATPETTTFENGARVTKFLVTVKSEQPTRRLDVLPVVLWIDRDDDTDEYVSWNAGDSVWIAGSVQRRFWQQGTSDQPRTRIEIVAHDVQRSVDRVESELTSA